MSVEAVPAGHASAARSGAAEAAPADFREFYLAHFPRIAAYAWRLTGDREAARDIAQEALTRTFTRWVGVRNPEGYVYLAVTNLVRDRWRSHTRERSALSSVATITAAALPAADSSVRDAVERLPRKLRDVVLLHYFADLPVEHVAAVVHRPVGTVKQRLHAARRLLAGTISGDTDD